LVRAGANASAWLLRRQSAFSAPGRFDRIRFAFPSGSFEKSGASNKLLVCQRESSCLQVPLRCPCRQIAALTLQSPLSLCRFRFEVLSPIPPSPQFPPARSRGDVAYRSAGAFVPGILSVRRRILHCRWRSRVSNVSFLITVVGFAPFLVFRLARLPKRIAPAGRARATGPLAGTTPEYRGGRTTFPVSCFFRPAFKWALTSRIRPSASRPISPLRPLRLLQHPLTCPWAPLAAYTIRMRSCTASRFSLAVPL